MPEFRTEEDTLGPVQIPADALWGPQTERSRHNFPTGQYMPIAIIRALLNIKKAAAQANMETNAISEEKGSLIVKAVDELLALSDEDLRKDFPLKVYQTGSGTQTKLKPAVQHLIDELKIKQDKYWETVKVGRTHLQDAVPLTFGQEVSGYVAALEHDLKYIEQLEPTLEELAIGGTAVGTGLNAAEGMPEKIAEKLSQAYGLKLTAKSNKFYGLSHHSGLNVVHGALKTLAADMFKIAQDIRFLASGPRAGYGELHIPANEPGSSIMPGKVNPTQAEAVTMAALRVFGNDVVVSTASSQGNFEMNVFKPVMIDAFLESADLLTGTTMGFADKMIHGLTVNEKRMKELLDNSLMTVTALSPHIGYHDSAKIAQAADKAGSTLKEAALKSGKVTEEQYDEWMDPLKMTNADRHDYED